MTKICIRGDSIARGAFDYDEWWWANRLHKWWLKNNNYIYNLSISSNDTRWVLFAMEKQIEIIKKVEDEKAYVYIFAIGINDARYINKKLNKVVPIKEFKANLQEIIKLSKVTTNKIMFLGISQVDESKTSQVCKEPWEFYDNDDLKEYNKCIENTCKENNIDFISIWGLLNPSQFEDGLHPDWENHKIIFEKVKNYIIDKTKKEYMLDTHCFDYILEKNISVDELKTKGIFYTSDVQHSEIKNITNNSKKREALLKIYKQLNPIELKHKSGIWIDDLHWDDTQIRNDDINKEFHELQQGNPKHSKDALIGELITNTNIQLITSDKTFQNRCKANGITTIDINNLI